MRNVVFAAIIGLAICQQAWAWDDDYDYDDAPYRGKKLSDLEAWELELDRNRQRFAQTEMLYNQERSLQMQEENLKIQKKRLALEEEEQEEARRERLMREW